MSNNATILALALTVSAALAGEAPEKVERQGPLAGLPSAPGPTIEKIKALGDNQWANLGAPAPDPKWGKARGRSWSSKMPYASDLGGAFLHGQGVHGYIKPDGYFMDDIWFYDLYAHRWICLYPGLNTKTFIEDIKKGDLKLSDDGQLVDKEGRVVPFSSIAGHSYQDHFYDPDLGRYVFGGHVDGIGSEQHVREQEWCKKGRELLLAQGKTDKVGGAPYCFNTVTGKFERHPAARVGRGHGGAGGSFGVDLYYLPSRKMYWQRVGAEVRLADPKAFQWNGAGTKGTAPQGWDVGMCYDSKRDRIYVSGAGGKGGPCVYIYDAKTNAWSSPANKDNAVAWPGANACSVHYDTAADRVLAFYGWNTQERAKGGTIFTYNPEDGSWEAPQTIPANMLNGCVHGFYSPEVNAHFIYVAHDSDDRGTMWVYRHKRSAKQ